jgi:hypothetical protein
MAGIPLPVFLPAHLALERLFPPPAPERTRRPGRRVGPPSR